MKKENRDFYLPLLAEGEEVLNVTESVIAVRSISGEVRVYRYSADVNGRVCLCGGSFAIVHHNEDLLKSRCLSPEGLPF